MFTEAVVPGWNTGSMFPEPVAGWKRGTAPAVEGLVRGDPAPVMSGRVPLVRTGEAAVGATKGVRGGVALRGTATKGVLIPRGEVRVVARSGWRG